MTAHMERERKCRMLMPEQKADLKLFLRLIEAGGQPDDEFLRDFVDQVAAYKLRGRQSRQRDAAVALYYHRARMMATRASLGGVALRRFASIASGARFGVGCCTI
jgi:hypothetical protein